MRARGRGAHPLPAAADDLSRVDTPRLDLRHVLVTGGGGMIGSCIPDAIKPSREECDVCNPESVGACLRRYRPEAIVHLAAIDLRRSEQDPSLAMATNIGGTYAVACAARAADIPVVFFSSGAVFDGKAGAVHDEASTPDPVNVYGHTKHFAELLLAETHDDCLIVRTGLVFGGSQAHHRKFFDVAIDKARRDEPIRAVDDRWGSPTYVQDLLVEVWRLLAVGRRGIVHVANAGAATGLDITREIVDALASASRIEEVHHADLGGEPARAVSEVLGSRHVHLRGWQEALREYIASRAR